MNLLRLLIPKQRPPEHSIEWSAHVPAGEYVRCTCGVCDVRPTRDEALDAWLDHCWFRSISEGVA